MHRPARKRQAQWQDCRLFEKYEFLVITLDNAEWADFYTRELVTEIERYTVKDRPRRGSFPSATKEVKEEPKTIHDVLFECLTTYEYTGIVDQGVEEEHFAESLAVPEVNAGMLNDFADNNYWRSVPMVQINEAEFANYS